MRRGHATADGGQADDKQQAAHVRDDDQRAAAAIARRAVVDLWARCGRRASVTPHGVEACGVHDRQVGHVKGREAVVSRRGDRERRLERYRCRGTRGPLAALRLERW